MYYNPEQYGLEIVEELNDPDASYSFDMFVIWIRKVDRELFYGTDSGCSCPSPFERELIAWGSRYFDAQELQAVVDKVRVAKMYKCTLLL